MSAVTTATNNVVGIPTFEPRPTNPTGTFILTRSLSKLLTSGLAQQLDIPAYFDGPLVAVDNLPDLWQYCDRVGKSYFTVVTDIAGIDVDAVFFGRGNDEIEEQRTRHIVTKDDTITVVICADSASKIVVYE